jgi:hypothetical protein
VPGDHTQGARFVVMLPVAEREESGPPTYWKAQTGN